MAVSVSTSELEKNIVLVVLSGTVDEVLSELATHTSTNYAWNGSKDTILAFGGSTTSCFVIYKSYVS